MSTQSPNGDQNKNLTVVFIEPPKWTAPDPEVWEQLKPPKQRRNKGK